MNVQEHMQGNSNVNGDDVRMEQLLTDHYTGHTIDGFIENPRGQDTAAALIHERKADDVIAAVFERLHGHRLLDLREW